MAFTYSTISLQCLKCILIRTLRMMRHGWMKIYYYCSSIPCTKVCCNADMPCHKATEVGWYSVMTISGLIMTTTLSTNGNLTYVTIDAWSSKWVYRVEHTHTLSFRMMLVCICITYFTIHYTQTPDCPTVSTRKWQSTETVPLFNCVLYYYN